ncbi:hypothetical protein P8V03_12990 [Clostridium sp. A1-XYC3]|uniref:Uncharacterized protein n=1 Tax=Clostridium tanneri TaxID=3037988 RepID=A0ABU4JVD4_9CLOT|nr:hypothetical protein [Clostridium sp. A1-XYC3]MDW8802066.1 hypothetical protein [Clostridium sp. A1-XYC3]
MHNQGVMTEQEHSEQMRNDGEGAVITNSTSENIIVYGPTRATDSGNFDKSWYILHPGKTTPRNGEFRGFFIPKDRKFEQENGETVQGPAAVMYSAPKVVTITSNEDQYVEKNEHNDGVFHAAEINWPIPDFSSDNCQNMTSTQYEIQDY